MKKFVCFIVMSTMFLFCIAAQESLERREFSLSVEDAVTMALENNVSLKKGRMDLTVLERADKYSWNSVSPSFSLSGNAGTNGTVLPSASSSLSYSATGSINLNFSPALFTSMRAAELALESGNASFEATVRSIELSVRQAFYRLIYTKENIALRENAMETARQTYESTKIKYNIGQKSELDLLQSQYSYESQKPAIESLKNSYENSLASFKQILGVNLNDEIVLTGNLEDAVNMSLPEQVLEYDLNELPSVKTIYQKIETAKNSLTATKYSAYGPTVTASGTANFGGGKAGSGPSLSLSASLGVRIPLDGYMAWSNGAQNIEKQKTEIEKLELDLENERTNSAIKIRNAYNEINQANSQLASYERNVNLMEKTYKMTKDSYNVGAKSLSDLQNAADRLASAKNDLQNQRYTIISRVLELESLLGLPFGSLKDLKQEK